MSPRAPGLLIVNGFDRSGTSMIGGLLSRHPRVSYLFQPFSRTEIHRRQYQVWPPDHVAPDTERFLAGLVAGRVDRDYLGADLFDRHSKLLESEHASLAVVKETKLHFKIRWLKARFPSVAFYGIWRDPRGILCSLLRNDFAQSWYGEKAFQAITPTIAAEPLLEPWRRFLDEELTAAEKMALVIAARTRYMSEHLSEDEWIVYEDVVADADAALAPIATRFGLDAFAFSDHVEEDYNVSGLPFQSVELWRTFFSAAELERLEEIFGVVLECPVVRSDREMSPRLAPAERGHRSDREVP